MHRLLGLLIVLALPAVFIGSCGGEGKCPSGSECTLIDCSCTDVKCDLYNSVNSVKVFYLITDGGVITQYTATITFSTKGISPIEGHEYTGDEINNDLVTLYRPDSNWDQTLLKTKSSCKIDSYGGANGQFKGSCNFMFHHQTGDYNAHMPFNCTLEPV